MTGRHGSTGWEQQFDPRRWAVTAAFVADGRKGIDTVVIDVAAVLVLTDLFVITHANNARQVRAIVEGIDEALRAAGGPSPVRVEGADDRQWVLLDYGAFVVHVFDAERRAFYQLERLWGDCAVIDWPPAAAALGLRAPSAAAAAGSALDEPSGAGGMLGGGA